MFIKLEYGTSSGVLIELTGDEVTLAILEYLVSQGVKIAGTPTVNVNGVLCSGVDVFVDPSGDVTLNGGPVRLVIC